MVRFGRTHRAAAPAAALLCTPGRHGRGAARALFARLVFAVIMVSVSTGRDAAHATGGIECRALDGGDIAMSIIIGIGVVPAPVNVWLQIGNRRMSDMEGDGEPVLVAQSYFAPDRIMLDLVDRQGEVFVARLRIEIIEEGRRRYQVGTLHLPGDTVYPMTCEGP